MWSTRTNVRMAQMSCTETFRNTIVVARLSGAVCGVAVGSLAVRGISVIFSTCASTVERGALTKGPVLLIGHGSGASFVAMFAQLGGGIYTKATNTGAHLCVKIELGIR